MKLFSRLIVVSVFLLTSSLSYAEAGKKPVSTGKYITGGVLGSAIGFGIGHAVQGRYAEDKAWIFTATEAAGFTLLVSGAAQCKKDRDNDPIKDKCGDAALSTMTIGLVTMIGFHVWEIVDVWTGATPVENNTSAFLIPDVKAPGIGVVYRF